MGIIALRRPSLVTTFDPAALALTGWWRGNFSSVPWAATASAGISGPNGSIVSSGVPANDPTAGTALNGYTPADFSGSAPYARQLSDMSTFFTSTSLTIVALFRIRTAAAANASVYLDAPLFGDAGGNLGLAYNAAGSGSIQAYAYAGAYKSRTVAAATGSYHVAMLKCDGTNLGVTVDSLAESTVACGTLTTVSGTAIISRSYSGVGFLNGAIMEMMTCNTSALYSNYSNVKGYFNARYGLAL